MNKTIMIHIYESDVSGEDNRSYLTLNIDKADVALFINGVETARKIASILTEWADKKERET